MEQTTPATLPALRERAAMQNTQIGFSDAAGFDLAQRIAKAFSMSSLVPAQYQNNIPNCLIAIDMAQRIGISPMQAAQNLYVVQGRPSWSAKFLIGTFNQCGRYSSIRYEWQSEQGKPDWGCRAYAFEKTTGERVHSSWITWKLVEAEGWNKKFVEELIGKLPGDQGAVGKSLFFDGVALRENFMKDKYEIFRCYRYAANDDGIPGLYRITFSPYVDSGPAKDMELLRDKHGKMPFVEFMREALGE
jgi:hypothetical protein